MFTIGLILAGGSFIRAMFATDNFSYFGSLNWQHSREAKVLEVAFYIGAALMALSVLQLTWTYLP